VGRQDLQVLRQIAVLRRLAYKVRALGSIAPAWPAALSSKSGRPTSPTKMKSPVRKRDRLRPRRRR
jgi:hypothetical protein